MLGMPRRGPDGPTLEDGRGLPIQAADFRNPQRFQNGPTLRDVYRTLMTGLAGTPMPWYEGALKTDQAWASSTAPARTDRIEMKDMGKSPCSRSSHS
jgi:hypothetical protein